MPVYYKPQLPQNQYHGRNYLCGANINFP